jgi:hypothetical protein
MRHLWQFLRIPAVMAVMLTVAAIVVSVAPVAAQPSPAVGTATLEAAGAGQPSYGIKESPKCRYEATAGGRYGWTEARLRRIAVPPPLLYAVRARQTVGWRFVVQRSIENGPWTVTYRSPIQKSTAYSDRPASFTKMVVDVKLPAVDDKNDVEYRTLMKMFWYRSDGTTEYKVSDLAEYYELFVDGRYEFSDSTCRGEIRQFFDGPTGAS